MNMNKSKCSLIAFGNNLLLFSADSMEFENHKGHWQSIRCTVRLDMSSDMKQFLVLLDYHHGVDEFHKIHDEPFRPVHQYNVLQWPSCPITGNMGTRSWCLATIFWSTISFDPERFASPDWTSQHILNRIQGRFWLESTKNYVLMHHASVARSIRLISSQQTLEKK